MSILRNPLLLLGINLSAIAASTYLLREHHIYNLEEHEARMDELEGTLRGHIGLIEEALDRLEGKGSKAGEKMSESLLFNVDVVLTMAIGMTTMAKEVVMRSDSKQRSNPSHLLHS